ncbi:helix-turn-helix transcriptional regulator [Simplicispira hankyongi]|uniref:YafY family transcriptional regulator n=1 Tax=Simplicispira hankyongi TaxID=2315688 RepID=A0A398CGB4_9BURK|nr:YafY family protein [Simplicispira hankyongi]RID98736.1 YafY family transcriptional regulator [Simplicispira hankyongi]
MSRAARLLQLLEALRGHRRPVSATTLAAELHVSPRTLYRDVATLREQGAQIDGAAGMGYVLQPGFTLPPLMFGEDEIEALVLGVRWVALQADPTLAQAARQALERIRATLPGPLRLAVDTSGLLVPPGRPVTPEPWLPTLRRAIRTEQSVHIAYRDAHETVSQRTVWPFAMAFFQESRMLAAWCELRQDFRHFRADRVVALTETGLRYPARRHTLMRRWRDQMGYPLALD